jgi:hypothetical protein
MGNKIGNKMGKIGQKMCFGCLVPSDQDNEYDYRGVYDAVTKQPHIDQTCQPLPEIFTICKTTNLPKTELNPCQANSNKSITQNQFVYVVNQTKIKLNIAMEKKANELAFLVKSMMQTVNTSSKSTKANEKQVKNVVNDISVKGNPLETAKTARFIYGITPLCRFLLRLSDFNFM